MNVLDNKIQCFQTIFLFYLFSHNSHLNYFVFANNTHFQMIISVYIISFAQPGFVLIKFLISILWCREFGDCFPFCYTRKEQFQIFPEFCCQQNLSWREKKSVWHTTLISVIFVFANKHIHLSVLLSFWEHNTQYTVNSHFNEFLVWRWPGARNCSNSSTLCAGVGRVVQHKELDGIQRLREER